MTMTLYTPYDVDSNDWDQGSPSVDAALLGGSFLYEGTGLSLSAFGDYIKRYNFGSKPPCFVVLHHTSIPDTQYAKLTHGSWDAGEEGLSEGNIYTKRQNHLATIRDYYRNSLGWDRGPHLFIDDKWIWLFTPMYYPGIHAAQGNGTINAYSIGIEVVGHYERVRWPEPVAQNVGGAISMLQKHLDTFEITHRVGPGGISSHRDYNKPQCPGAAITEDYYLSVIKNAYGMAPSPPQKDESMLIIGIAKQRISKEKFWDVVDRRGFGLSREESDRVYTLCCDLNICAAFILATGLAEHGPNLQASKAFQVTRNVGNQIWYPGTPYSHVEWPNGRVYLVFESAQISMMHLIVHLKYAYGYTRNLHTLEDIVPVYLAHSEKENQHRVRRMKIDIHAMSDLKGAS